MGRRARIRRLGLAAAAAAVAAAGCGKDEDGQGQGTPSPVAFPASWAGIWQIEATTVVCGTDSVLGVVSEPDTICAGEELSLDEGGAGVEMTCSGTITDGAADLACEGSFAFQGVTCAASGTVTMTRTGDVLSGTSRVEVTCDGGAGSFCLEQHFVGTRTSTDTPGCPGSAPPAWLLRPGRLAGARAGEAAAGGSE